MIIPNPLFYLGFGILIFYQQWYATAEVTLTGCYIGDNGLEICTFPGGSVTTFQLPTPAPSSSSSKTESEISITHSVTPVITPVPSATNSLSTAEVTPQTSAVTACHMHGSSQYCKNGAGDEVEVVATALQSPLPTAYNGCHTHGDQTYCIAPGGKEVEILSSKETSTKHSPNNMGKKGKNCHYHAGVEHCVSADGSEESNKDCGKHVRDYNVNLRIGLLFVILITSAIGVFTPILLSRLLKIHPKGVIFTFIKQFGTGIIISTAFIHLLTHAELMFANTCLGELKFESTATSIAMAGGFLAFLVDYLSHRLAQWQQAKAVNKLTSEVVVDEKIVDETKEPIPNPEIVNNMAAFSHHHHNHGVMPMTQVNDSVSLLILEAGIIFHSLLIGITLVVAGDSVFITLFIVIIFHQMFEGLALGARIAASKSAETGAAKIVLLPIAFSFVTPLGMAIGIGVLQSFNGNDAATIITLGTLDALSAGILIWVGFVDMWAGDWMFGDLVDAGWVRTLVGLGSLIAGFALMGLLGKWA